VSSPSKPPRVVRRRVPQESIGRRIRVPSEALEHRLPVAPSGARVLANALRSPRKRAWGRKRASRPAQGFGVRQNHEGRPRRGRSRLRRASWAAAGSYPFPDRRYRLRSDAFTRWSSSSTSRLVSTLLAARRSIFSRSRIFDARMRRTTSLHFTSGWRFILRWRSSGTVSVRFGIQGDYVSPHK